MARPDMAAIIRKLQKFKGPDPLLNSYIAWEIGEWECEGGGYVSHKVTGERKRDIGYPRRDNFTDTIDAALSLVPEHYSYELTKSAAGDFSRARLWDWRRSPAGFDPGNEWKSEGNRPLAINICIAALTLRLSLQPQT